MAVIYSYVVAYDSGFAPNPFGGICTLATCKPDIRKHASVGDWVIGTGSNRIGVRRGGFLVYAMRITEFLTFSEYWDDPRFESKKPSLYGSYKMACGDNIYRPAESGGWTQQNSYHSLSDGSPNPDHVHRDTSVNRVLISNHFVYFGAEGPEIPEHIINAGLLKSRRGYVKSTDHGIVDNFENWFDGLYMKGYQGRPYDMIMEARSKK